MSSGLQTLRIDPATTIGNPRAYQILRHGDQKVCLVEVVMHESSLKANHLIQRVGEQNGLDYEERW